MKRKRLTLRMLRALADVLSRVQAGDVTETWSYDTPETQKAFDDAMNAYGWVEYEIRRRKASRRPKIKQE